MTAVYWHLCLAPVERMSGERSESLGSGSELRLAFCHLPATCAEMTGKEAGRKRGNGGKVQTELRAFSLGKVLGVWGESLFLLLGSVADWSH